MCCRVLQCVVACTHGDQVVCHRVGSRAAELAVVKSKLVPRAGSDLLREKIESVGGRVSRVGR